jgi:hypothetical protein
MVVVVAPGQKHAAHSRRWPLDEWVIRGSIVLLLVIGVGAIWGQPIKQWLGSLGGTSGDDSGGDKPRPPAGTL